MVPPGRESWISIRRRSRYNATISDLTKTKAFDELRVVSILNEIGGKDHSGTKTAPVPTIFGMNFQSLNAAKKISGTSGYTDHIGTPDALLADGLYYVDGALQRMVDALRAARLLDSTAIIVTAKHGETPLDPPRTIVLTTVIPNLLNGALGAGAVLKATQKSNAIIWLKNQSNTLAAANLIDENRASTGVRTNSCAGVVEAAFPRPPGGSRGSGYHCDARPRGQLRTHGHQYYQGRTRRAWRERNACAADCFEHLPESGKDTGAGEPHADRTDNTGPAPLRSE